MRIIKSAVVLALIFLLIIMSFSYLTVRLTSVLLSQQVISVKLLAGLLLFAELFGIIHSTGYFLSIVKVLRSQNRFAPPPPLTTAPVVAILVPSYKEPIEVLRDTLICCYNLNYSHTQIYLLDDSPYGKPWDTPEKVAAYRQSVNELCEFVGVNLFRRKWRGAKAGIINDFLHFLEGQTYEQLDYRPCQGKQEMPKYMVVFDADMNPFPNFIEPLVAYMEADPKIAFIQTPQYYSNFESNKVARAAGYQQIVFFEYICEAKSVANAMFCCGTNVILRREALMSVGGFDESSVTEDIATSFKMHMKGWSSRYFNKIAAFGLGPEDLGGYFTQQFRWAKGTLSEGVSFLPKILKNYSKKPDITLWWEYFLSYTYYLVGWSYLCLFIFPIVYLIFDIPAYFLDTTFYFAVFVPYIVFSIFLAVWTLMLRQHSLSGLLCGMFLMVPISFPIYIHASLSALFKIKSAFKVTPKGQQNCLPLPALWPQLLAMIACAVAMTWGVDRIYYEREPLVGLVANVFWCGYNFAMISTVFYFNDSD